MAHGCPYPKVRVWCMGSLLDIVLDKENDVNL